MRQSHIAGLDSGLYLVLGAVCLVWLRHGVELDLEVQK